MVILAYILLICLGTFLCVGVPCIIISNITEQKKKKRIHIYYINKLKNLSGKIYEQEDDDYPVAIVIRSCERWQKHWLQKANVTDPELQRELLTHCQWYNDNCAAQLEKLGWTILRGKENI